MVGDEKLIVRQRILERFGEPAYTLCELEMIFLEMGLGNFSSDRLRYPAQKNSLLIPRDSLEKLDIQKRQKRFGYVLRSNVKTLAGYLDVTFSDLDFEDAVQELGYYVEVEK